MMTAFQMMVALVAMYMLGIATGIFMERERASP